MNVSGKPKRALIVGAGGQDGMHLTRHLAAHGYEVIRVSRDAIAGGAGAARPFDVLDSRQVTEALSELTPHEVYYLAAHHHSAEQEQPDPRDVIRDSMRVHFDGLVNMLEGARQRSPATRVFLASSVLVFGELAESPQRESTPMRPDTAYGVSKLAAMGACRMYREQWGVFASAGILFNHDSALRPATFVSRKIVKAAVAASRGQAVGLRLGSLDVELDWSAAEDVVRAMHLILQLDAPDDFVIASGELHSVREFAEAAFDAVGLDYEAYVTVDDGILHRPAGAKPRLGDISRLSQATGYRPEISFQQLVRGMVAAELTVQ